MEKSRITENDADESDSLSDDSSYHKPLPRRRSATVSPAAGTRFRHHSKSRRRSEMNLISHKRAPSLRLHDESNISPRYENKGSLRKTNSMPSFEQTQQVFTLKHFLFTTTYFMQSTIIIINGLLAVPSSCATEMFDIAHVEAIRQLLDLFPIAPCNQSSSAHEVWQSHRQNLVPKMVESESEDDIINTDIEELRDAAQSIQSLQRVLKVPPEPSNINVEMVDRRTECPMEGDSSSESLRQSGIASRLGGHPRGVIQFLPSAKQTQFFPTLDTYNTYNKNRTVDKKTLLRRKTSLPEIYDQVCNSSEIVRPKAVSSAYKSGRWSFRSDTPNLQYSSKSPELMEQKTSVDLLTGVSRFSKLLRSLRSSRQNSPEPQTSNSWNPLICTTISDGVTSPLMQADLVLWSKRSRASIRRHNDVRNMAIRELCDTEKTFVENLEYLTQKYMRPLRQPLECTLIDPILADKIFYKHFLAALCDRLDTFQAETRIGDVLLSHFRKQSMVDTYIAFVDNFKFSKQSIKQARERPAFEKRDHRNKLDLDSLLISPIQRVPRYELIVKVGILKPAFERLLSGFYLQQIIKHTSVDHADYDSLLLAQKYIHELATTINRQKEESEEMEQRLREIEAIVDGLDDLVTTGRSFNRYDVVTVLGIKQNKQRCLFLMSDQIIVTNVKRKPLPSYHSPDFLNNNRFKLLFKISLDDVVIAKDTLSLLHTTEMELQNVQEDINVVNKMTELSKLLKKPNVELRKMLENLETEAMHRKRILQEQLASDPLLTIVQLQVTTMNGIGILVIQFPSADRRAVWENALIKAKTALKNEMQNEERRNHLKSIVTYRTRPGLTVLNFIVPTKICNLPYEDLEFSVAAATLGKSAEGAPNVWVCTSDKFSGQIAVVNVNGEPTIESTTSIGNAAIVAICSVPAPRKKRKLAKLVNSPTRDFPGLELDSTSSESDDSDSLTTRRNVQSTVWIGNEDGEIFVFNFLDNVRMKACERMARLPMPVDDIVYLEEKVFVSISSSSHTQLLHFQRNKEGTWDLDNPRTVQVDCRRRLKPMGIAASRLCFASGNSLYLLNASSLEIEKQSTVSTSVMETVVCLAVMGSTIFVAMNKSSIVKVINAFTLDCQQEFSISHVVNKALSVCQPGHIGPCRFLTAVSATALPFFDLRRRRMSLSAPTLQQIEQMFVVSGGEGFDSGAPQVDGEKREIDDAVNHLLFWSA
uniref:DH domain-containing protein n=1 Tax=Setaria digitata TaxID=48799 RepID=A0A915PZP2_9BILA